MSEMFHEEPWEGVYRKGLAVGHSDIRTDRVNFTFRDEVFSFTTDQVVPHIARHNGYFYEARVRALRDLEKKNKNGKAKKEESGEKARKRAA